MIEIFKNMPFHVYKMSNERYKLVIFIQFGKASSVVTGSNEKSNVQEGIVWC